MKKSYKVSINEITISRVYVIVKLRFFIKRKRKRFLFFFVRLTYTVYIYYYLFQSKIHHERIFIIYNLLCCVLFKWFCLLFNFKYLCSRSARAYTPQRSKKESKIYFAYKRVFIYFLHLDCGWNLSNICSTCSLTISNMICIFYIL